MTKVRVRFAPSPTGFLHIGGVRTALFNYLLAKQTGGSFILRLEDTDQERFVPAGVEQIVASLDWLGLKPDEGFWISTNEHQGRDYVQSERHRQGYYQKWADQLVKQGLAYYSPTSKEKLTELREQAKRGSKAYSYKRMSDPENTDQPINEAPIRLDAAAASQKIGATIDWRDEVRGIFKDDLGLIEDFILIKGDGFPTYNFANIIDDHDMQISHVIRGDEFIASTAKHALLYDLLGWERPVFIHLPVINGTDGKKLSKRSGDTDVIDFKSKGYLPQALINFLALLGWHPGAGETQEQFSLEELIKRFSIDQIQKSPAIFDPERLDWMNGLYLRAMTPEALLDTALDFLGDSAFAKLLGRDRAYSLGAISLIQDRLKRLDQIEELAGFFFTDPNPKQLDYGKVNNEEAKKALMLSAQELRDHTEMMGDDKELENFMRTEVAAKLGDKPGPTFMTLRIAMTGQTATPGLFETMVALGQDTVLRRLDAAIGQLK